MYCVYQKNMLYENILEKFLAVWCSQVKFSPEIQQIEHLHVFTKLKTMQA